MKSIWFQTAAWLAAVTAALMLAFATPSESSVMGRLPSMNAKRLDQQRINLPEGLPAGRTLALVAFQRSHRGEIDSWIQGLQLHQDSGISWVKMPVLNDPGTEGGRSDIENRLLARHTSDSDRARLVPVFTNRDAFVRAAGLSGIDHVGVLVVGRDGQVLARVEGRFDEDKAQALRETLLAQGY
jgi:hypothetical protein